MHTLNFTSWFRNVPSNMCTGNFPPRVVCFPFDNMEAILDAMDGFSATIRTSGSPILYYSRFLFMELSSADQSKSNDITIHYYNTKNYNLLLENDSSVFSCLFE